MLLPMKFYVYKVVVHKNYAFIYSYATTIDNGMRNNAKAVITSQAVQVTFLISGIRVCMLCSVLIMHEQCTFIEMGWENVIL